MGGGVVIPCFSQYLYAVIAESSLKIPLELGIKTVIIQTKTNGNKKIIREKGRLCKKPAEAGSSRSDI